MPQAYQGDIAESIATTPRAGQLAENTGPDKLRSGVTAEVLIPPGSLVCNGSTDLKAKRPTSAAEVLSSMGVAVYLPLKSDVQAPLNQEDYAIDEALLYLEKGEIWVPVEAAVTRGQQCLYRHTANGGGGFPTVGMWRGDANTGASVVPACRFESSTVGAGFARARLNLPATA